MKPAPFAYADPGSIDEVLELLAEHGDDAVVLAGGQSLVPDLNFRRIRPRLVIDLRRVTGLSGVTLAGDAVVAGAGCGVLDLAAAHPASGVAEAVSCIGHPQIRCRSTVGGTVALA
ncbi:MAG TPA: FAD binding domain-containing protein, partial [Microthrixaceae bacterium]|nr:FAD binding domain-containing protein [Microthrixaceae bacterium]